MAKIDTTQIPGYAEMSPEDKLKALEGFDYDDHAEELERTKSALTKANKEAADRKRLLEEKQTEEERKTQAEAEEKARLEQENAQLKEKVSVSDNTSRLLALGYPADLAAETAKAMFDGDNDKVFANQKKFQDQQKAQIEAELLSKTPTPPAGDGKVTAEAFGKMSWTDKAKLKLEDPDLFQSLSNPN